MIAATAVKGIALTAVALVAVLALRRAHPSYRHAVWAGAFAALLALPFASVIGAGVIPVAWLQTNGAPTDSGSATGWWPARWTWIAMWSVGALCVAASIIGRRWQLRGVVHRAEPLGGADWQRDVLRVQRELGTCRAVRLLVTREVNVPAVPGILKPRLLLPASARHWKPLHRLTVLRHELAHVARNDALWCLMAQLSIAIHWFNPLAWWGARRLRVEAELCADDRVLSTGVTRRSYAEFLVSAARQQNRIALAGLAIANKSALEERILAIVSDGPARKAVGLRGSAITALGAVCVAATLACVGAANHEGATATSGEEARDCSGHNR